MQTLYRKFRPQKFSEVFGQEAIIKVLKKQVKDGKVGHAYLFSGSRGTGKTSIARLLAKAVNCMNPKEGDPCMKCKSCKAIEQGKYLDLVEIDAASNRGIDEIRKLKERVNFSPGEGNYKVYIIDEVHMLTKDAFNALLKTLEEPPGHVIFILATTEPHKVIPTILSRCQRFNFLLASDDEIVKKLKYICKKEGVSFTKEALYAIAKNARGSFRDSESILEKVLGGVGVVKDKKVDLEDVNDILGLAEDKQVQSFIDSLLEKDVDSALSVFNSVSSSGVNLVQFIRQTLEKLRELLLDRVSKKKAGYTLADILKMITELSNAEAKLKYTQLQQLPIEVAVVKICSNEDIRKAEKSKQDGISKKVTAVMSKIPRKFKRENSNKNQALKLKVIERNWEKVIEKMRPYNHHLSAFYRKARPIEVQEDKVILEVPFRFHKQRIESKKSQDAFREIAEDIFDLTLSCFCRVVNTLDDIENDNIGNGNVVLEVLGDIME